MTRGDTTRGRATTAFRPCKATTKPSRPTIPSVHASRGRREAALGIAPTSDGTLAPAPTVASRQVVVDPIPSGVGDLPVGRLASTTPILGPTGGRTTTTPILEAASSGPIGVTIRAPGVSSRVIPFAVRVASSGSMTVLRDSSDCVRSIKLLPGKATSRGDGLPSPSLALPVVLTIILNQGSELLIRAIRARVVASHAACVRAWP